MNEDLERDLAGTGMLDFAAALRAAPQACVSTGFADGVMAAILKDWADFIGSVNTQGANIQNPPAPNGGNAALGSLSMEEYIKARTAK